MAQDADALEHEPVNSPRCRLIRDGMQASASHQRRTVVMREGPDGIERFKGRMSCADAELSSQKNKCQDSHFALSVVKMASRILRRLYFHEVSTKHGNHESTGPEVCMEFKLLFQVPVELTSPT